MGVRVRARCVDDETTGHRQQATGNRRQATGDEIERTVPFTRYEQLSNQPSLLKLRRSHSTKPDPVARTWDTTSRQWETTDYTDFTDSLYWSLPKPDLIRAESVLVCEICGLEPKGQR